MRLIDADNLLKRIGDYALDHFRGGLNWEYDKIAEMVETMPTHEERKHGHWIIKDSYFWHCSNCNVTSIEHGRYCNNCGACMDGEMEIRGAKK